jgi:SAM-dependent methyltransferase
VVFSEEYAGIYDLLYQDKDYEKECDLLEGLFRKYDHRPASILDLGCGTGSHALILAKRGYKVTGVDRAPEMIAIARRKAQDAGADVKFIEGDITNINLCEKFDAVISMFAVMSYLVTNDAVAAACKRVKDALVPGGLFVFDCWHGLGVITDRPTRRIKESTAPDGEKIVRSAEPEMDLINHIVTVRFSIRRVKKDRVIETRETHIMRYFFPQEIKYYLKIAGFKNTDLSPFLDIHRSLSEKDWNMLVVGQ